MAAGGRQEALALYKALLRESGKFTSYNYRRRLPAGHTLSDFNALVLLSCQTFILESPANRSTNCNKHHNNLAMNSPQDILEASLS
ncbi:LYR motif-containing protein 4 [Portunus trituberculatus]|uniref:LYR motif-containing protein 4 n=1 Tax=Portunus trituberculatus TaxID=210409 RepID=A0A5B7DWF7_PORTR|nr:LYR motif-containing protein 4 [Portunus trituberculatus]